MNILFFQDVSQINVFLRLKTEKVKFPNATLSSGWYTGKNAVTSVTFDSCNLHRVGPNAFTDAALATLKYLTFFDSIFIHVDKDFAIGLNLLHSISFYRSILQYDDPAILAPVKNVLTSFHYEHQPANFQFEEIFGPISKLTFVTFVSSPNIRILAPSNFSIFYSIRILELENCGIEVILDHTFDYIGLTLNFFSIVNNKLKTLPATLFNHLIEMNTFASFESMKRAILIYGNPFVCGCEMYEIMSSAAALIPRKAVIRTWYCDNKHPDAVSVDLIESNCSKLKVIHTRKLCLDQVEREFFVHRRFSIKFDKEMNGLRIKVTSDQSYRVYMRHYIPDEILYGNSKRKCPRGEYIFSSVSCRRMNQTPILTIEDEWRQTDLTTFCLNYIARGKAVTAWPTHCITLRWNEHISGWAALSYLLMPPMCVYIMSSAICGIFFGPILLLSYRKYILWKNRESNGRKRKESVGSYISCQNTATDDI